MSGWRLRSIDVLVAGTAALLAAAAFSATTPAPASAARFTYELCDTQLPGGGEPGVTFGPDNAGAIAIVDSCPQADGSLYLYQQLRIASGTATANVAVPATPGGWVETETLSAGSYRLGPGNERSYVHDEGWPSPNAGEQTRTFFEHNSATGGSSNGNFPMVFTCSAAYAPGCEAGAGLYVRYISALEVDPTPPTLGTVTGPLLEPGLRRGHQQLNATASDLGGGVQSLEVLVNGIPAAGPDVAACRVTRVSNSSYSGVAADSASPCPPTLAASWDFDTASYPFRRGPDAVQVCASDFATVGEPNRACSVPAMIRVDDSCQESGVAGGASLTARVAHGVKGTVTLPFGEPAMVSGTLRDAAGTPIPGATICVETKTERAKGGPTPIGTATTGPDGRFAYTVPPGPNREVLLGYRQDTFQLDRRLTVRARVRPSLAVGPRKLANGGRLRLKGSLPKPDAAGRVVVLQANVPGAHRWITFRKATTGRRGHFRARYHFTSTTRRTTYRFRALVPRQAGYPWAQGASTPVSVVVSR